MTLISLICPICLGDLHERDHAYKCQPVETTPPPAAEKCATCGSDIPGGCPHCTPPREPAPPPPYDYRDCPGCGDLQEHLEKCRKAPVPAPQMEGLHAALEDGQAYVDADGCRRIRWGWTLDRKPAFLVNQHDHDKVLIAARANIAHLLEACRNLTAGKFSEWEFKIAGQTATIATLRDQLQASQCAEKMSADIVAEQGREIGRLTTRCRVLLGIAGAGLNGTDEADELANKHTNHYEAFNESYSRHRARVDETLEACLKPQREVIAALSSQREAEAERIGELERALEVAQAHLRNMGASTQAIDAALQSSQAGERCCCGEQYWPRNTAQIETSQGVTHYRDKPCTLTPPPTGEKMKEKRDEHEP